MIKKIVTTSLVVMSLAFLVYAQEKPNNQTPANAEYNANQAARELLSGNFEIDPAHTRVSFIIPHLVISEVEGRFGDIKGSFTIGKTFLESKFNATVATKSIDTGIKRRDDHLRSADFFDVKKYPTMSFESKTITGAMDNFKMVAALTIKGVTKDVLLSGSYTGFVKDQQGKERVGLKATGKINRKDFNINFDDKVDLGPIVGDTVEIRLWAEGIKK